MVPCLGCRKPTNPRRGANCRACRRKRRREADGHISPHRRAAARAAKRLPDWWGAMSNPDREIR